MSIIDYRGSLRSTTRSVLMILGMLFVWAPAYANELQAPNTQAGWMRPPIREQAEAARVNLTNLAPGQGLLLVPAMSAPEIEPAFSIRDGVGAVVVTARPGKAIVLDAGSYTLQLGSDPMGTGRARVVLIQVGELTVIEPDWAGLRINVVDPHAVAFRGAYEVLALPSRAIVGTGFGAQPELGERLQTWILEPGDYMVIRRGESVNPRENFFTLHLKPGVLHHHVLVMDPEDGGFRGMGDVLAMRGEGTVVEEDLTISWTMGVDIGLLIRRGVPGTADATELTPSLFTDFTLTWQPGVHLVWTRTTIEEAFIQEDWGRFDKEFDEVRFDLVYAYQILSWLGPYWRLGMETSLFPSYHDLDEPVTVVDERDPSRVFTITDHLRIAEPFDPLTLKGGAGLRLNAAWSHLLDFWSLLGVGARHMIARGVISVVDDDTTPELEVLPRGSLTTVGLEGTVFFDLSPLRWLVFTLDAESFMPFDTPYNTTVRIDAEVALRLASFLSITYGPRVRREPLVSDRWQVLQEVLLRFTWTIL